MYDSVALLLYLYFDLISFSKRKANRDLAMAKFNEGNINAATEMFQVLNYCDV